MKRKNNSFYIDYSDRNKYFKLSPMFEIFKNFKPNELKLKPTDRNRNLNELINQRKKDFVKIYKKTILFEEKNFSNAPTPSKNKKLKKNNYSPSNNYANLLKKKNYFNFTENINSKKQNKFNEIKIKKNINSTSFLNNDNKNINNIKNNKNFLINFYNQISNSYYLQRKFNDALKYNEIVFQIDNKNKKAFLLLINILYDLNEIDKCLLIQDKIINIFKKPKDIEMFKNIFYKINMKQLENNKMEIMENNYKMEKKIIDFFNNDIIKWSLAISGIILSGFLIKKILKK